MDGLTTNGVLVMHPAGDFVSEPTPGVWREISVCGNVFALRETRSAQQRGKLVSRVSCLEFATRLKTDQLLNQPENIVAIKTKPSYVLADPG